MCQIIHKPAGFTVPKHLIESTCLVNADGFGIMMWDDEEKKLYHDKAWEGDNDADTIFPILEALHDKEVFIHFRYRTKGKVDQASCHPFVALDDAELGRTVTLMHNGTLSGFGSADVVDSQDFAVNFVGPLYKTFLKSGVESPLYDDMFGEICSKFIGSDSKIVMMDNTGCYITFNRNKGDTRTEADGTKWWVSNTYSFNRSHRTPTNYQSYGHGKWVGGSFYPFQEGSTTTSSESTPSSTTSTVKNPDNAQTTQTSSLQTTVAGTNTSTPSSKKEIVDPMPKRTLRKSYITDILKLDSVDDLQPMTFADIEDLVDYEPDNAKLLINDLLIELLDETANGDYEEDEDEPATNAAEAA